MITRKIQGRTITLVQETKLEMDDLHVKLLKDLIGKKSATFKIKDGSIEEEITIRHIHQLEEFKLIKIDKEDDYYRVVYYPNCDIEKVLEQLQ